MKPIHLHYVWDYTRVDRAFWAEHLEDWVPHEIVDAHTHVTDPALRLAPMMEEMRRQYWVNELSEPIDAAASDKCIETVFPGRRVRCVAMGLPSLAFDIEKANQYLQRECPAREWHALSVLRPEWDGERVARELAKPGVIGVKPYYSLLGYDAETRDRFLESDIFDFLPHRALEVLNHHHAWVTLHVPKAERLPHPDNLRAIREIRRRYPDVSVVIAHFGRCYTELHARDGLPALADDPGIYFDNSAVLNPAVHRLAFEQIGPSRILYGTDNPVFYTRGRRQWQGRTYVNRTSHPFHFNRKREPSEIEARYTLYMYEALRAIKDACQDLGMRRAEVQAVFRDNARRLIERAVKHKPANRGAWDR